MKTEGIGTNIISDFLLNPSLWGSLIGSGISALVAITIMQHNIKHERRMYKRTQLESSLKEARFLEHSTNLLIRAVGSYIDLEAKHFNVDESIMLYEEFSDIKEEDQQELDNILKSKEHIKRNLFIYLNRIKSIDRQKLSTDNYQIYLEILGLCENQIEDLLEKSYKLAQGGYADTFSVYLRDLKGMNSRLKDIINLSIKELEELK
ncbi:hypothetical protein OTK50_15485 [Bacillus sp. NEAU-CP5]|uniref:hypothetical protein n=1 Tax=Bacillus TaxID=1386 RepID=UPI0005E15295|nr:MULTISPECIES: hypothetical protein [Bacillus]MCX3306594.1 hypothetical protein [Bacillus velezensis]MCX8441194.1 hypothetical protein [Bacillus sp. NEAU-CP5]QEK97706.1 hypothetical protein EXD81_10785 [Bacillus amyloliquefaciens]COC32356.1 Uncharacterised protein [Streptococcus pneumoniae]